MPRAVFELAIPRLGTSDYLVSKASTDTGQHNSKHNDKHPCPVRDSNLRY